MDTARADHFGCYGYPLSTTPAVDRLAREGALFEQAFTQATNTVPSHASLFTGLYPVTHRSRFNGSPLSPKFETLASRLSGAGYRTAAFVSGWSMNRKVSGMDRGFQTYDDHFPSWDRRGKETVDLALDWLRSLPPGRPYFLFVHLFDPHGNYDPPAGYADRFRVGAYAMVGDGEVIASYQRLKLGWKDYSHDPLDYISRYDGEINYDDEQIGRLLEAVGKDPVVVFAADHGETLIDRYYYFDHGDRLNEEQIHVPLILRFPDRSLSGKRVRGMARLVDVLPTLLSYLGRPVPESLPGRDLLPGIRAGTTPEGARAYGEARAEEARVADRGYRLPRWTLLYSVRTERYKLIAYPTEPRPTLELFDLAHDPGEKKNLAALDPGRAGEMYGWIREYVALGPPPVAPEEDVERDKKLRALGYVN
jgi:arylsulfatase A-like enzyme